MTKRRVYALYGDAEALETAVRRLMDNGFHFHWTGEFLYDSEPWDSFIDEHCGDIRDRLTAREECWIDEEFTVINNM